MEALNNATKPPKRADIELKEVLDGLLLSSTTSTQLDFAGLAALCNSSMLIAALDLLDHEEVTKLNLPNGRTLYQVAGSAAPYLVSFGDATYPSHCPCAAFAQTVLATQEHVLCKHLLACRLADSLNRFTERKADLNYLTPLATNFKIVNAPS